ncbi:hypothetical protein MCELHM10_03435 [Paracoccaceae bacterium]
MSGVRRIGEKIMTFGAGVAIKKVLDYGFDYGVYPVALVYFGYFWGGVIMTIASVFLNLAVIRAYDWSKRDWLMLETLKELKHKSQDEGVSGFVSWALRKGDIPAFFLLSWLEDAIVVTLYLRHGVNQFNGLARRDWMIFWAATVVSNLFWIMTVVSVIEIFRLVF